MKPLCLLQPISWTPEELERDREFREKMAEAIRKESERRFLTDFEKQNTMLGFPIVESDNPELREAAKSIVRIEMRPDAHG